MGEISDNPLRSKDFPFTAEHFLEAVDDSSKRSRRILLVLIFTSTIILMVLINSFVPQYNWFASKSILFREIANHIYFSDNSNENAANISDLKKYIYQNESINYRRKLNQKDSILIERISDQYKTFPVKLISAINAPLYGETFEKRILYYKQLGKTTKYVSNHQIVNRDVVQNYLDKLDGAEIEHIDLVRVPILGVSFHINYLGFYSGITLIVLYFIFYFSLKRESINTKIAFRRGWDIEKYHHYYYYEYVSMLQVLSIPRKLFVYQNSNFLYKAFSKVSIFFPYIIYWLVAYYDVYSYAIGEEINTLLAIVGIAFEFVFIVILTYLVTIVINKWSKMDDMWDNQALEFNFECILEKIGIDKEENFVNLTTCSLTPADLTKVECFWQDTLNTFFRDHKRISTDNSVKMYSKFINKLLIKDSLINYNPTPNEFSEFAWKELYIWYSKHGRKEISSAFRQEFLKTILNIRSKTTL